MAIWRRIVDEFGRSPVATVIAPVSALIGASSLASSWWLTSAGSNELATAPSALNHLAHRPGPAASLLVIGCFLSLTTPIAIGIRAAYRWNAFIALLGSIVAAALAIFLNLLNATFWGFPSSATAPKPIDNLLFYGTALIFIAIAGGRPIVDFAKSSASTASTREEGAGVIAGIGLAILIWGALVAWAQRELTAAFLS